MGNKRNIILIGMPGSGKSTIGKLLSEKLGKEFIDTDEMIEKVCGVTISEIFSNQGEIYFRKIESQVVQSTKDIKDKVIATGGGIILKEENIHALKENGIIFFIDRPIEHIFSDVDEETRPLLKDRRTKLYDLYEIRYPLYLRYADYRITNCTEIDIIVEEICEKYQIWE